MIQIEDDIYEKLKKDADDNRQIKHLCHLGVALVIFLCIFFTFGTQLINLDIQRRTSELNNQLSIEQAEINRKIIDIESEGMTKTEYFKWLEVRSQI